MPAQESFNGLLLAAQEQLVVFTGWPRQGERIGALPDHALPGVPIHIVYSSRRLVTAALAAFLDFMSRLDLGGTE